MAKNLFVKGNNKLMYGVIILVVVIAIIYFVSSKEGLTENPTTEASGITVPTTKASGITVPTTKASGITVPTTRSNPIKITEKPFYDPYLNPTVPVNNAVIPFYPVELYGKKIDPSTFTSNDAIGNIHFFSTETAGELLPSCFTSPTGGIFGYVQFTSPDNKWNTFHYNGLYGNYSVDKLKIYFLDEDCSGNQSGTLTDFTNFKIPTLYYNRTIQSFQFRKNDKRERYFVSTYGKPIPTNKGAYLQPRCKCVQKPSICAVYFLREKVFGQLV